METGGFSMLIILQCPQSAQMENPLISCSCLKHQHTAIMLHALLLCRWLCLNHKAKSARRLVPSVLVYLLACFQLPVTEIPTQTGWNIKGHFYFLTTELKKICDRAGFRWDLFSTQVVFLWNSQSSSLSTYVSFVLRLTFSPDDKIAASINWFHMLPCSQTWRDSKQITLKNYETKGLKFLNFTILEPIMLPR